MNYYDLILGLIPLALAGVTGGLLASGFTLTVAIPLASLVTLALIGHGMFVNAPTDTLGIQSESANDSNSAPTFNSSN